LDHKGTHYKPKRLSVIACKVSFELQSSNRLYQDTCYQAKRQAKTHATRPNARPHTMPPRKSPIPRHMPPNIRPNGTTHLLTGGWSSRHGWPHALECHTRDQILWRKRGGQRDQRPFLCNRTPDVQVDTQAHKRANSYCVLTSTDVVLSSFTHAYKHTCTRARSLKKCRLYLGRICQGRWLPGPWVLSPGG